MEQDEQIRQLTPVASRIAREAEIDIVPGTEVMTDIGGAHFQHAADNPDAVVLIPQPSDDPHDPLVSIPRLVSSFQQRSLYTLHGHGTEERDFCPSVNSS